MKRTDMVKSMVKFYESIPDGASSYHKMDMLLSRLERLEMMPPKKIKIKCEDWLYTGIMECEVINEWEPENET